MRSARRLMLFCWWSLTALQLAWHGLVPPPTGNQNWILASIALAPLLLLARPVLKGGVRGQFWGMLLVMLYFMAGVTEAWSNPDQRVPAVLQVVACLGYFSAMVWLNRRAERR